MTGNVLGNPILSVVIPALNEEESIGKVLQRIKRSLDRSFLSYEIIVVDDGSTDRTAMIAKAYGARVISKKQNSGYGAALKAGLFQARGQFLAFLDADSTYPPEVLPLMLKQAEHYSLVVGSRFTLSRNGMRLVRKVGNLLFAVTVAILTLTNTTDVWSGLRIFDRQLLPIIEELPDDLTFTPIMTLKSILYGFSYHEIRISYAEREGRSKLNEWRDGWSFLKVIGLARLSSNGMPKHVKGVKG